MQEIKQARIDKTPYTQGAILVGNKDNKQVKHSVC